MAHPVPALVGQPELGRLGPFGVTPTTVRTPAGEYPLAGSRWDLNWTQNTVRAESFFTTPVYWCGIILGAFLLPAFGIGAVLWVVLLFVWIVANNRRRTVYIALISFHSAKGSFSADIHAATQRDAEYVTHWVDHTRRLAA